MNNSLSLDFYQLDMQCLQLEMSLFESFVITEANELDIRRDFSNSSSTKPKDIKKENAFKTIKEAIAYSSINFREAYTSGFHQTIVLSKFSA